MQGSKNDYAAHILELWNRQPAYKALLESIKNINKEQEIEWLDIQHILANGWNLALQGYGVGGRKEYWFIKDAYSPYKIYLLPKYPYNLTNYIKILRKVGAMEEVATCYDYVTIFDGVCPAQDFITLQRLLQIK